MLARLTALKFNRFVYMLYKRLHITVYELLCVYEVKVKAKQLKIKLISDGIVSSLVKSLQCRFLKQVNLITVQSESDSNACHTGFIYKESLVGV